MELLILDSLRVKKAYCKSKTRDKSDTCQQFHSAPPSGFLFDAHYTGWGEKKKNAAELGLVILSVELPLILGFCPFVRLKSLKYKMANGIHIRKTCCRRHSVR